MNHNSAFNSQTGVNIDSAAVTAVADASNCTQRIISNSSDVGITVYGTINNGITTGAALATALAAKTFGDGITLMPNCPPIVLNYTGPLAARAASGSNKKLGVTES